MKSTATTEEKELESEKCDVCGMNDANDLHTCPYAEEIDDDDTSLCNCCSDCTCECAMDV